MGDARQELDSWTWSPQRDSCFPASAASTLETIPTASTATSTLSFTTALVLPHPSASYCVTREWIAHEVFEWHLPWSPAAQGSWAISFSKIKKFMGSLVARYFLDEDLGVSLCYFS